MKLVIRRLAARTLTFTALLGACALAAPSGHATTYAWDPNANRSDAAGSGLWNTTSAVWDSGTADVPWTNSVNDSATFGGADGTYTITVANGINANSATFNASGYTLTGASAASPGTLTLSAANPLLVAGGKTLTIGANMTVSGPGPSYINNFGTYAAGAINVNNGGTLTGGNGSVLGGIVGVGANGSVSFTGVSLSGATVTVGGANASFNALSSLGISNSTVTINQGSFGTSVGNTGISFTNATVNLNGGTFNAGYIPSSNAGSTFNFNGGVFLDNSYGGFQASGGAQSIKLVVQAGGAKFNIPSDMTIPVALQHDAGGPAIDGGLNKSGGRTLTLSLANTYTGGTTIEGGKLAIAANGGLGSGDASVLATSVSLSIGTGVTMPFSNPLARLILAGGGTANMADAGYLDLTSGANISVGSLVLGTTTYTSGVFTSTNFPDYILGTGTVTVVPEPGSFALALALAGGLGLWWVRRARTTQQA